MSDDQDIFAFSHKDDKEQVIDADSDALSREVDSMAASGSEMSSPESSSLAEWTASQEGVKCALVTNPDGSLRAASDGTPEDTIGLFGLMITESEQVAKSLTSSSPYGVEIVQESGDKLLTLKLKSGYLCASTDEYVGIPELINKVRNRPKKEA